MADKFRTYDQTRLQHQKPRFRVVPGIGIHLVSLWTFGWQKPNRRQRARARRGQR